jgi:hypothetical protein
MPTIIDLEKLNSQFFSFGKSRLPLNIVFGGKRRVVAGNKIYDLEIEQTFHDFLWEFGLDRLGNTWLYNQQSSSPVHPLARAFNVIPKPNGEEFELSFHSPAYCFDFLTFAYDLYSIEDNVDLQGKLLKRIRLRENYFGARYELFVAATFARTGFALKFEQQTQIHKSAEFVAEHKATGKRFAVEAKHRVRESESRHCTIAGVDKLLKSALEKVVLDEFLIFVDVNLPNDNDLLTDEPWHNEVTNAIKKLEANWQSSHSKPRAIVYFTNRAISSTGPDVLPKKSVILGEFNTKLFEDRDIEKLFGNEPVLREIYQSALEHSIPPKEFLGQNVSGVDVFNVTSTIERP